MTPQPTEQDLEKRARELHRAIQKCAYPSADGCAAIDNTALPIIALALAAEREKASQLYAAAPAMLDALKKIADKLGYTPATDIIPPSRDPVYAAYSAACMAIELAEGPQSPPPARSEP